MLGCKCRECFGLAEHMLQLTGRDYGLPRASGHSRPFAPVLILNSKNRVVEEQQCTGSYTCSCPLCAAEREHRVTHLTRRPKRTRQPWETTG